MAYCRVPRTDYPKPEDYKGPRVVRGVNEKQVAVMAENVELAPETGKELQQEGEE